MSNLILAPFHLVAEPIQNYCKQNINRRVLIIVDREDEGSYGLNIRIHTRRELDYGMQDWLSESAREILDQIPQANYLQIGERFTALTQLTPWSTHCNTQDGPDYDCGWIVSNLRIIKRPRHNNLKPISELPDGLWSNSKREYFCSCSNCGNTFQWGGTVKQFTQSSSHYIVCGGSEYCIP